MSKYKVISIEEVISKKKKELDSIIKLANQIKDWGYDLRIVDKGETLEIPENPQKGKNKNWVYSGGKWKKIQKKIRMFAREKGSEGFTIKELRNFLQSYFSKVSSDYCYNRMYYMNQKGEVEKIGPATYRIVQ